MPSSTLERFLQLDSHFKAKNFMDDSLSFDAQKLDGLEQDSFYTSIFKQREITDAIQSILFSVATFCVCHEINGYNMQLNLGGGSL
jgi:hypothetical protein